MQHNQTTSRERGTRTERVTTDDGRGDSGRPPHPNPLPRRGEGDDNPRKERNGMVTELMPAPAATKPADRARLDPTAKDIIAQARKAPASGWGALTLSAGSALLLWASFTPLNLSPLGWFALVPLLLLVRLERPTSRMYLSIYAGGALYWIPTLQWLRLGDPTMY